MIYNSRILYTAFSSSAHPLFGQLAFHGKSYCCKKLSNLPLCLLLNKVMLQTKHQQKLAGVDLTTTKLLFWECKMPIGIRQYFCPKPQVDLNSRHTHLAVKSNDAQFHQSFTYRYSVELSPTYLLFCFLKAPQLVVRCLKPQRAFPVRHPVWSDILFLKLPQQKNQPRTCEK